MKYTFKDFRVQNKNSKYFGEFSSDAINLAILNTLEEILDEIKKLN
jgi:hypothetical protein